MAGLLDQVTKGKIKVPDRMIVWGPEGVGKTTFGSMAPDPMFVQVGREKGTHNLDTSRLNIGTYQDLMSLVSELTNSKHSFKTLVLDSYTQLEQLIYTHTCLTEGVSNIEQVGGGFNKGYIAALPFLRSLLEALEVLQLKTGMGLIGTAHAMKKSFTDPSSNATYDRYTMSMHDKFSGLLKEWHDMVLFANHKVFLQGKPTQKQKAFGDGSRVMYSEYRPGFDAKSRYKIPFEMPLSYAELRHHIDQEDSEQAAKVKADIEIVLASSTDETLNAKVRETVTQSNNNVARLSAIKDRLVFVLKEKEEQNGANTSAPATTNAN